MVDDMVDPRRSEPNFVAPERDMLEQWLEYHRITLELKCEGVSDEARKSRPVSTSLLSLHGLVRHMAEVERGWFQRCLSRRPETPRLWVSEQMPDGDLAPLATAVWTDDLARFHEECESSRITAKQYSLDYLGVHRIGPCSLRWIYNHMIEEYARHNGHADLLREMIDGEVGC